MISSRIARMNPSVTIEMEGLVASMHAQGLDVVALNAGEPDFSTPENIKNACFRALNNDETHYITVSGILPLREAICEKLQKENGVCYTPDQIVVSTGAKQAINNAVLAVCNPGDEVIIPTPCWVSYEEIVKLAEATPVLVPTDPENYQLDLAAIEAAVTDKTKAIMINSPNNPTGAVYSEEALRGLAELAIRYDFYIISDEVYEKLVYDGAKHVCLASFSEEAKAHTIVINGFSKTYAMTGWRLGYSASTKEIARGIASLQGHTTSNSTTFVQWAGIEALRGQQDTLHAMIAEYAKRREYLYQRLSAIPGVCCANVKGAFYLLPDVSAYFGTHTEDGTKIDNTVDFCNYVLREASVAILPGAAFEAPKCVRIAYSNSMENIARGMDRMEAALAKLK